MNFVTDIDLELNIPVPITKHIEHCLEVITT